MHISDLREDVRRRLPERQAQVASGLFAAIALLMAVDLGGDAGTGAELLHLLVEGLTMVLALAGVGALWQGWRRAEARAEQLHVDLMVAQDEARRYRDDAGHLLRGLGEAIDRQFARWALTPAEREVGLLMLKGLSHREVAGVRSTAEITVRQQALAVYRKSGLRNRAELSAYFLEDLLLPHESAGPA